MTIALRLAVANGIDADGASVRALAKLQQVLPTRLRGRVDGPGLGDLGDRVGAIAGRPRASRRDRPGDREP